jgi:glucosamine-6-phosphate deaminase
VHTPDHAAAGERYEHSIREAGGVDLQLLGIGQNGHVGFNEPGSEKSSRTRVVLLTEETREANRHDFAGERIPTEALSMGISTILAAKSLLMLATGKSKADAIKYLLNHHDDPSCPATYLKEHPQFTLVLDPEAAGKINLKI